MVSQLAELHPQTAGRLAEAAESARIRDSMVILMVQDFWLFPVTLLQISNTLSAPEPALKQFRTAARTPRRAPVRRA
jgi:hypothetical protein